MWTDGLSSLEMTELHTRGEHRPAHAGFSQDHTSLPPLRTPTSYQGIVFSAEDQKVRALIRMQRSITRSLQNLRTSVNKENSCTETTMVICSKDKDRYIFGMKAKHSKHSLGNRYMTDDISPNQGAH